MLLAGAALREGIGRWVMNLRMAPALPDAYSDSSMARRKVLTRGFRSFLGICVELLGNDCCSQGNEPGAIYLPQRCNDESPN